MKRMIFSLVATGCLVTSVMAQKQSLPTLFVEQSTEGFETYMAAAITKKNVPVIVVTSAEKADYVLKATQVQTEQVTTGKRVVNCLFAYCAGNNDKGNVSVQLVQGDTIAWSYSVNKARGEKNRQALAEAIAKHLKEFVQKQR